MDTASSPSWSAMATATAVISSRERFAGRPVAACSGRIQMTSSAPSRTIQPPPASLANTVPEPLAYFANIVCEADGGLMVIPASGQVRYARNGDVRIAFADLGGAGGDPLLLIMGLAVSRFWWPDSLVADFVDRGFHVAAYDQRDAGQSTHFPDAGTASPLAAVLHRSSPAYTAEDMT